MKDLQEFEANGDFADIPKVQMSKFTKLLYCYSATHSQSARPPSTRMMETRAARLVSAYLYNSTMSASKLKARNFISALILV